MLFPTSSGMADKKKEVGEEEWGKAEKKDKQKRKKKI